MNYLGSVLIFLLIIFSDAYADNYLVIMGGGGEPKRPFTIFDSVLSPLGNLTKDGWKTEVSFNGGHWNTERIIKKHFESKGAINRPFTQDSYRQMIKDYEDKIMNGQIKSGDQLMLFISSHGGQREAGEKSHKIALSGKAVVNFQTGEGADMVSLDELDNLIKIASEKGIKLALIDGSCHSGSSLALKHPNTCIVSASGEDHYSYNGFPRTFTHELVRHMDKGTSLEDAFLKSRDKNLDMSFPMISTSAGVAVNVELYELLRPYLFNYQKEDKFNKFSSFLEDQISEGETCDLPNKFEELKKIIVKTEEIESSAKKVHFSSKEGKKLKKAVENYYNLIEKMRKDYLELDVPELDGEETFCTEYELDSKKSLECWKISINALIRVDFFALKGLYGEPPKNSKALSLAYAQFKNVEKAENRAKEISSKYPDLKKKRDFYNYWPKLEKKTKRMALYVAWAHRDLYKALYLKKNKESKQPNPCKDFIF